MQDISYRVTYQHLGHLREPISEVVRIQARSINTGYVKALRRAQEPLGSGERREIVRIEFWEVH